MTIQNKTNRVSQKPTGSFDALKKSKFGILVVLYVTPSKRTRSGDNLRRPNNRATPQDVDQKW